jgi:hypothetical protein
MKDLSSISYFIIYIRNKLLKQQQQIDLKFRLILALQNVHTFSSLALWLSTSNVFNPLHIC